MDMRLREHCSIVSASIAGTISIGLRTSSIPITNSLSERSLRGVKSKMKVSGQFESVEYAQYYATLRSYGRHAGGMDGTR